MTEEPRGWELQRAMEQLRQTNADGFAGLHGRIDKLVTQEAFQAEQRYAADRFRELREQIADEEKARVVAIAGERAAREESTKETRTSIRNVGVWVRWVAAGLALPTAFFIASILANR